MNKRPDSWEDPPEDPPEDDDPTVPSEHDDGDYLYDQWKDRRHEEDLNKDCSYWENLK